MPAQIVRFRNFAKLNDTNICFNDITVIAGRPGSGKSYVMKAIYALNEVFSLMDHKSYLLHYVLMNRNYSRLVDFLKSFFEFRFSNTEDLEKVESLIDGGNFIELRKFISEKLKNENTKEDLIYNSIQESLENLSLRQQDALNATEEDLAKFLLRNILQSIFGDLSQISDNFEIKYKGSHIQYDSDGFEIKKFNNEKITSAIFVETPLILEFEQFLPNDRFRVPYHIDSLLNNLRNKNYAFTSDELDEFKRKFNDRVNKIIGGEISKNTDGFQFKTNNGKVYSAVNASSGTKSLGLLQYLVENGSLQPGSILFWEEPEVHLHPEWQLKMVELFIELMNMGVKIVFSTHSPYMYDYLNAYSIKEELNDRIAFNLLKFDQDNDNGGIKVDNIILKSSEDWKYIRDELLGPLEEIMWNYI